VPQKRQDAQIKTALAGSPLGQMLDPRQFLVSILDDLGLKNPETYVTQGGQPIPPEALQVIAGHLAEFGMDPQQAQQLIMASVQETIQAKDAQAQAAQHGADQQGGAQGQPPMAA
jgi:hypothetical protein